MDENDFLTYQKYPNKNDATELIELLTTHRIEFLLEDNSASFDPTFSNSRINQEFRIKLKKENFAKADQLLLEASAAQLNDVSNDHYLFDFSDDELIEVLSKSDEWNKFDYLLAQKILKDRGREVNDDFLETLRKQRVEELAKPESSQRAWVIVGYVCALFGGLLGLFIGWHLLSHKKTLPNGEKVYGYSPEDRKHGNRIVIIGTISMVIWLIVRVLSND